MVIATRNLSEKTKPQISTPLCVRYPHYPTTATVPPHLLFHIKTDGGAENYQV